MNTLLSSSMLCFRFAAVGFVVMGALSLPAHAQCSRWTNELELPGFTPGADSATLSVVRALERFDDGTGPVLVAGGNFVAADGVPAPGLAQWNGSTWTAMNPVVPTSGSPFDVSGLLAVGSDLYVGGRMPAGGSLPAVGYVSRVGATPAVLGTFTNTESASVRDFAIFGTLHAGGYFKNAGGTPANHIARYTGSGWAPLGTGLNGSVNAMEVFDDGSGAQLYVAGNFLKAGGISTYGMARWNGTSWSTAGAAFANWGWFDLELFDDGTGPGLYAAVWHEVSGELVMKYGGNHWSIIGVANGRIHAVATLDDGNGRALYAAGQFTSIDGISANSIAKWDGTQWSSLGGGLAVTVAPYGSQVGARALESFDDGSGAGPKIFAAGLFNRADADSVKHISAWEPCTFVGNTFCFGDGSLSTPCPCAPPSGSSDAGCTNSHHLSGAKLTALGTTSPDHVRLRGTTLNTYGFTVLLSGTGVITGGVAYGSGVRCVDGSFVRFGSQFAAWGAVAYPNAALGFDRPLSQVSGVTPGVGQTRFYQALYRDTGVNSCAPPWVNLSNAVEITW